MPSENRLRLRLENVTSARIDGWRAGLSGRRCLHVQIGDLNLRIEDDRYGSLTVSMLLFFLPTTLLPAVFVAAHVVSLIARRPLMGIVVNPRAVT